MKILCLGDSTSLPGHTNTYEDTWIYSLKKEFPSIDFITFFKRNITTNILVELGGETSDGDFPNGADCLEHYQPQVIIIQLGIVDCAPRLIDNSNIIWKIVRRLPKKFIEGYIAFLKRKRHRDINNVIVSKDKFRNNLNNYIIRCKKMDVKHVFFINIPIPGSKMLSKNLSILENVISYQKILNELSTNNKLFKTISVFPKENVDDYYSDGYHPNPMGNKLISDKLISILKKIRNTKND